MTEYTEYEKFISLSAWLSAILYSVPAIILFFLLNHFDATREYVVLISTNVQPGSRGELLSGASYRQDHEQESDHGDESDTVSAGHEPDGVV